MFELLITGPAAGFYHREARMAPDFLRHQLALAFQRPNTEPDFDIDRTGATLKRAAGTVTVFKLVGYGSTIQDALKRAEGSK